MLHNHQEVTDDVQEFILEEDNVCSGQSLLQQNMFPLLNLARETMTDQSMDTSRVQPGKPISIIDVTHRNMHEGLLTGIKVTQR